ncbi:MAG: DNA double-strand break repair nuclease NurA [Candidatus Diapherotrites archaeon]|uniref:DNA double-strand break repair nuclease NurA n=1 Tax=Candidatus Iainarchaeum sp. TaxID=3101447 RepID=A0A8T4L5U4_9ARCH|nr:DNA double-strand break repair nuclease NurA [Candidatus Diapherotrites archaeon]
MQFNDLINEAVETIHSNERKRVILAKGLAFLREEDLSKKNLPEVRESQFIRPCPALVGDVKVVGVDSGFCVKSLHSVDVVLVRCVGVCFSFENGSLVSAEYEPSFFQFPKPFLFGASILDLHELEQSKSLIRLREEISMAREMIEKKKPDFCLLDGSLIPQYADKPPKDSGLTSEYHRLLDAFRSLYETAEKFDCELVGCVEDSRGNRFRSILSQSLLPAFSRELNELEAVSDSVLLNYLLNRFERSFAFSYTKKVAEHPILNDLAPWGERIFACYLKPSALDRPLRVEFLSSKKRSLSEQADRVACTVAGLSSLHREYAYPSVLIEADMRAKLTPEEIDLVFNKIRDKLSRNVALQLRRNSRPF